MGVYLSKPCTDVHIIEGSHGDMSYTAGDMQGWRKNIEDDHIANTNVPLPGSKDNTAALFAVFDGHGGKEVAVFCQYYFVEALCKEDAFRQGNYKQALADTFLTMDSLLEGKPNINVHTHIYIYLYIYIYIYICVYIYAYICIFLM